MLMVISYHTAPHIVLAKYLCIASGHWLLHTNRTLLLSVWSGLVSHASCGMATDQSQIWIDSD
jgi:hypothetical protein